MDKKALRNAMISKRRELDYVSHDRKSKRIIQKLFFLKDFYRANNIMTFISFDSEVYTHQFIKDCIKQRKQIYVPIINRKTEDMNASLLRSFTELEKSEYGILAPMFEFTRISDPNTLDIIITPGVAFDVDGNRLGYGKGYYDRFFSRLSKKILKIALAFECQIVDNVYPDVNDIPVDLIITEDRIIECKNTEK